MFVELLGGELKPRLADGDAAAAAAATAGLVPRMAIGSADRMASDLSLCLLFLIEK